MSFLLPSITGFAGAVTHVIAGPDHLAAVTPFSFEEKKKAWKIGLFWGLGHLSGMLLIGIIFTMFQNIFDLDRFSAMSELFVGFILIGIGLWSCIKGFVNIKKDKVFHVHENNETYLHKHENGIHTHEHHEHPKSERKNKKITNKSTSFAIGTLHGFAGIAHFILFLPVLGFSTSLQMSSYLVGFAFGTIFAMVSYTFLLSKISSAFQANKIQERMKYFRIISGLLAIAVGLYWIFLN